MSLLYRLVLSVVSSLLLILSGCQSGSLVSDVPSKQGWSIFTNSQSVNDWVLDGDNLWLATDGGIVVWDTQRETYTKYTMLDGLVSNYSCRIIKDALGNLWAGSSYGISLFDGTKWEPFYTLDENDYITDIFIDNRNTLWIGTSNGVRYYRNDKWNSLTDETGEQIGYIRKIFQDSDDRFWFISFTDITCFDGSEWKIFSFNTSMRIHFTDNVVEDNEGRIWISTYSDGVLCIDGEESFLYTEEDGLAHDNTNIIFKDNDGNIWIGSHNGLSCFDGNTWKTYNTDNGLDGNIVYCIYQDSKDTVWCGSGNFYNTGGINWFDGKEWHSVIHEETMAGKWIIQISEDRYWLNIVRYIDYGYTNDLVVFNGKEIYYLPGYNEIAGNGVRVSYQDNDGSLWIGTYLSGVSSFDGTNWQSFDVTEGMANVWVTALTQDKQGDLWFSMFDPYSHYSGENIPSFPGCGVSRYNFKDWQNYSEQDGLASEWVWAIYSDSKGNLWFGTEDGLNLFDGNTWERYTVTEGLPGNEINTIYEDRDGNLWISTENGVGRYDGTEWDVSPVGDILDGMYVTVIIQDNQGDLWFGTLSDGLFRYDGKNWDVYTENSGLASNTVTDVVQDNIGYLWVGTDEGLNRYNGTNWASISGLGLDRGKIWDIYIDNNQNLWIATDEGLVCYTPNSTKD